MKLTKNQQFEIDTLKHFIPSNVKFQEITDKDIEKFFNWSDKGIPHNENIVISKDGFSALMWAKNRRDLQITTYIEDWGETLTAVDFVDEPEELAIFFSKRMKKPGIYTIWKLFNKPKELDEADKKRLSLMMVFKEQ